MGVEVPTAEVAVDSRAAADEAVAVEAHGAGKGFIKCPKTPASITYFRP